MKAATVAKDADGDTHANGMNNVLTEATNAKGNETTGITGEVKTWWELSISTKNGMTNK